ncbi:Arm DNA-binding domain-containing protein [Tropicimonas sp. IMCC34043]|nr:Arm DNA-binding domain-containing protein [Tropicimonas sp. IMCC34043]
MPKITKRPAEYLIWDSEIPGFGLRVLPSGCKGYVVRYRT